MLLGGCEARDAKGTHRLQVLSVRGKNPDGQKGKRKDKELKKGPCYASGDG